MPKRDVGTAQCPLKDCGEEVAVYAYSSKAIDAGAARFSGRLFCVCPVHGRIENQKYFEANTQWRKPKPIPIPARNTGVGTESHDTDTTTTDKPTEWLPNFFR